MLKKKWMSLIALALASVMLLSACAKNGGNLLLMLGISWGASAVTVPDFVSLAFLGILVLLIPGLLLFLPERRRQAT